MSVPVVQEAYPFLKMLELDDGTNATDAAIPFHLTVLVAITAPSNVIVTTDVLAVLAVGCLTTT